MKWERERECDREKAQKRVAFRSMWAAGNKLEITELQIMQRRISLTALQ